MGHVALAFRARVTAIERVRSVLNGELRSAEELGIRCHLPTATSRHASASFAAMGKRSSSRPVTSSAGDLPWSSGRSNAHATDKPQTSAAAAPSSATETRRSATDEPNNATGEADEADERNAQNHE